jgi:hypothetical protein
MMATQNSARGHFLDSLTGVNQGIDYRKAGVLLLSER